MRSDLNKVLCERGRGQSWLSFGPYRRKKVFSPTLDEDGENSRSREGMKFRYGYDAKSFNEHLAPLQGIVRKAVGRKWDSLYSELCKNFNMRSVINKHILEHLDDFIAREMIIKDGELFVRSLSYGGADQPLRGSRHEFFVDPRTNIIRRNIHMRSWRAIRADRLKEQIKEEAKVCRRIDEKTIMRKIDDTWFLFDYLPIPKDVAVFDSFKKQTVMAGKYHWHEKMYHTNRRTASKKDIRSALK